MLRALFIAALLAAGCRSEKTEIPDTADPYYGQDDTAVAVDDTGPSDDTGGDDTGPADEDGDGYAAGEDCDDQDASANPGADELCDGIDNDCDELVDEPDALDAGTWYGDADDDGYGDDADAQTACDQPSGYAVDGGDCDDLDPAYYPGAPEDDCADPNDYNCDGSVGYEDLDGDGYAACEECDDGDPAVNPDAEEVCNGIDDDCDGALDNDASDATTFYADADADGYGTPLSTATACEAPSGYVDNSEDCDDTSADVYPGATELCDALDQDCDAQIDEDAADAATWYLDVDADGYGQDNAAYTTTSCDQPSGYADNAEDCDDADPDVSPLGAETCDGADEDCDGSVDEDAADTTIWYADADADGYSGDDYAESCDQPSGYIDSEPSDCDDANAAINPGAEEVCDDLDNDCDGAVDVGVSDADAWYADADADGYGDPDDATTACDALTGYVSDASDCDDGAAGVNPGAEEVCNGIDDDCDGDIDTDATDIGVLYLDADGDGYGLDNSAYSVESCDAVSGYASLGGDCDDGDAAYNPGASEDDCTDPNDYNCDGVTGYADDDGDGYAACEECDDGDASVNPAASEICDGADNDCDGTVDDDASDADTFYADADGDGYGDADASETSCDRPSGYLDDSSDCDDDDANTNPGAVESCDEADDDCDGAIDEDASDASTWYADNDSDGYGDAGATAAACDQPAGTTSDASDCDDANSAVNPTGSETCDDSDEDCDGSIDEDASDGATWYADSDNDGYGDPASSQPACDAPAGYEDNDDDCDDGDNTIRPNATELCDGVDEDCDGTVDEDGADGATWYTDSDGDGYGDPDSATDTCTQPAGTVSDDTDCDDTNSAVNPGAEEVCDSSAGAPVDDDCDGLVDDDDPGVADATTWYLDADSDGYGATDYTRTACDAPAGYVADATDCDGLEATTYPGADEYCDGVDNDCDDATDEDSALDVLTWYADVDGDGYGDAGSADIDCDQPAGHVSDDTDCDDAEAAVNPAADEVCDEIDNDCDGETDEDDAIDASTWYADGDSDTFGDVDSTAIACDAPSGYVADDTDCDDGDSGVNPDAEETCDGVDTNCDGALMAGGDDADGDGVSNCEDPTVYSDDFDSGSGDWSELDLGGSNVPYWYDSSGYVYEASNAARTILYTTDDLGDLDTYTISVDIYNSTSANNWSGIVFDFDGSSEYYAAIWDDPTGYYTGVGKVYLYDCSWTACTLLDQDDGSVDLTNGGSSVWTTMSVTVDFDDVTVTWGGTELFTTTISGASPIGMGRVGLYSWDNDGGAYYDNLEITNP